MVGYTIDSSAENGLFAVNRTFFLADSWRDISRNIPLDAKYLMTNLSFPANSILVIS